MKPNKTAIVLIVVFVAVVFLGAVLFVGARMLLRAGVPNETILELDLEVNVVEDIPDNLVSRVVLSDRVILRDLVDALHRAAEDDRVLALVAKVGTGSLGFAATQELRDAIARFRGSGKPALAWAETFGEFGPGNGGYYLATAFDEIHLQPSGDVGLTGFSVDAEFYRGVFDKYDVEVQMDHRHEYKNAMNVYTEKSLTDAHRESLNSLIGSLFDRMLRDIGSARRLTVDEVRSLIDRAPIMGPDAVASGLVDNLSYRDEVYALLEARYGENAQVLDAQTYRERAGSAYADGPRIALILGEGNVTRGPSGGRPDGSTSMGSDTITKGLRLAVDDPDVEAIVFRVNCPGGSYVASDAIRREVERARTEGKPVIVSMGNVAASGGYFVAMNADRIVAQPGTITGSIGVLVGKLIIGGFFERFGVRYDNVHRGKNAEMWSTTSPYDDSEWERVQAWLDRVYEDFTSKAAEGRALPIDSVLAIAKGRVWSGVEAHAMGLVDTLGGYDVALDLARDAAGIPRGAAIEVRRYPAAHSLMDLVLEAGRAESAAPGTGLLGGSAAAGALERLASAVLSRSRGRLRHDPLGPIGLVSPDAERLDRAFSGR